MQIKELKDKYPLVYAAALKNQKYKNEECYINLAFPWTSTQEGHNFWNEIKKQNFEKAKEICPHLFESTEVKKPLVFGLYNIGDIVVSLVEIPERRSKGEMIRVHPHSDSTRLFYTERFSNGNPKEWRAATPEEIEAFDKGIRNIDVISTEIPKENKSLVGRYFKGLVDNVQGSSIIKGNYYKIVHETESSIDFFTEKHPKVTLGISKCSFHTIELMPEGFNPESEKTTSTMNYKFKVGDQVEIIDHGQGCSSSCKGEIVTILELAVYKSKPGYITTKTKGLSNNNGNIMFDSVLGEKSFELYQPAVQKEVKEENSVISGFPEESCVSSQVHVVTYPQLKNCRRSAIITPTEYYKMISNELPKKKKNYETSTHLVTTDFTFKKKPKKTILSI